MSTQQDKIETILESLINGNRAQVVSQIREYERSHLWESEGFMLDLFAHLDELYPDEKKLEILKDVIRALTYAGALQIT